MSSPPNPLDAFRTYSYHHIFFACDSTITAEALERNPNLSDLLIRSPGTQDNAYITQTANNGGQFVVIANGMVDSEFVLSELEWTSVTSVRGNSDFFTTMAVEGTMLISEPRGVRFMNILSNICDQLQSDPAGIIWMVKTIFVGHEDGVSDTTFVDYRTDIKPLIFVMYDITASFDMSGGTYNIAFAGINNGAAKLPQIVKASEVVKMSPPEGGASIKNYFDGLAAQINGYYATHIERIRNSLGEGDDYGKEVIYSILVADTDPTDSGINYADNSYVVDNGIPQNSDGEGMIFDFSDGMSIEHAIQKIMRNCSKVRRDLEDNKISYKITSTVVSEPGNDGAYTVVYKVTPFKEARADIIGDVLLGVRNENDPRVSNNLITFDYIYTGKNVDILEFDIKMEMGLAFFQTLTTTKNLGTQATQLDGSDRISVRPVNSDQTLGGQKGNNLRRNTPLYFSTTVKDSDIRNGVNPTSDARFQSMLSRHAALESNDVKMKIYGNPDILSSTMKLPSDVVNDTDENNSTAVFRDWERAPALAKINIRMPRTSTDGDYSEPFWYDGLYYIYSITNTFNMGEFTQLLEMVSLPKPGALNFDSSEDNPLVYNEDDCNVTNASPFGPPRTVGIFAVSTATKNARGCNT